MKTQSETLNADLARVFTDALENNRDAVFEFFSDYFFNADCWQGFALILSEASGQCWCKDDHGAELAGLVISSPQMLETALTKEVGVIEAACKNGEVDPANPIPGSVKAILNSRKLQPVG